MYEYDEYPAELEITEEDILIAIERGDYDD